MKRKEKMKKKLSVVLSKKIKSDISVTNVVYELRGYWRWFAYKL